MMTRFRELLVPALAALLVGAMLMSLGVWQLHRLTWKEALLARIEARAKAAPQALPPRADWPSLKATDYDYRRVAVDGTFRHDANVLIFHGTAEGPGYLVMTPLDLQAGGSVIVNRGFIPADLKPDVARIGAVPRSPVHVIGLMRPSESRNLFTPADEPARNLFFTRDPSAIAAHLGLGAVAPFTVDAEKTGTAWPKGGTTELAIPNNHLSYALTWFGLAFALAGVFAVFGWRRLVHQPPPPGAGVAQTNAAFRR